MLIFGFINLLNLSNGRGYLWENAGSVLVLILPPLSFFTRTKDTARVCKYARSFYICSCLLRGGRGSTYGRMRLAFEYCPLPPLPFLKLIANAVLLEYCPYSPYHECSHTAYSNSLLLRSRI